MRRAVEPIAIAGVALAVTLVPMLAAGWPSGFLDSLAFLAVIAAAVGLAFWRIAPALVATVGLGMHLFAAALAFESGAVATELPPLTDAMMLVVITLYGALVANTFTGRAAWWAGVVAAAYLAALYALTGEFTVGILMLTLPGYVAGTLLRLRRETAEQLAARARELEEERELYADLALRHERARIASELHDIVGHAISVMVVQAAAGQRLVGADPERAREAFAAIAESARHGQSDLRRLVELLGGTESGAPDLSLVDEVVARAARSGLHVTCRFEGNRDRIPPPIAHAAFRLVQESLTNALRYAPGADVAVVVTVGDGGESLSVAIENGPPAAGSLTGPIGSGRGLIGLRERVHELGGSFSAGATGSGGWRVEARLARTP